MISREVFYDRRDNHCTKCQFWRGACLKGHPLSSPVGCPIKKFPPIDNTEYHPDLPVVETAQDSGCPTCNGPGVDVPPMTWAEVLANFAIALKEFMAKGLPLLHGADYEDRLNVCKGCVRYRFFQCRHCRCIVHIKAKLATEDCPEGRWKRS